MLAQKMMNRQAPYGPIGMVSQNMSGNKKSTGGSYAGPVIFDATTASAGMVLSNNFKTATNPEFGTQKSAKLLYPKSTGKWYVEFTQNDPNDAYFGLGLNSFICNNSNTVGFVVESVAYLSIGAIYYNGSSLGGVPSLTLNDKIGIAYDLTGAAVIISFYKNGVLIYGPISFWNTALSVPIFTAGLQRSAIISSPTPTYPPPSGFIYLGPG